MFQNLMRGNEPALAARATGARAEGSGQEPASPTPAASSPGTEPALQPAPADQNPGALKTILLVEDDDLVRAVFRRILHSFGYFVIEATDGAEALTLARNFTPPIHLLVADMNLPQVGGLEVARRLGELHPESKVLLVSGFSEEMSPDLQEGPSGFPLLLKPFTADTFLQHVRSILGRG